MPPAVLEAPAPVAGTDTPPAPQKAGVAWWMKPPMDQETVTRFREMLNLMPDEELPENLLLTIGLRMACDAQFLLAELDHNHRCDLLMQAAQFPVKKGTSKVYSGAEIIIKSQGQPAIYICQWAFDRHLVNRYGIWFLLPMSDIDVGDESIRDSEDEKDRRFGKKARPKIPDPGLPQIVNRIPVPPSLK